MKITDSKILQYLWRIERSLPPEDAKYDLMKLVDAELKAMGFEGNPLRHNGLICTDCRHELNKHDCGWCFEEGCSKDSWCKHEPL